MIFISLCLLCTALPADAAERETTILRVGYWAFDGYHDIDESGKRSGYGYEMLQLMARYGSIGFTYHAHDQSFASNKQMLADGEIDLLTAIRQTEDNVARFDFSNRPIGSASTILTIKAGNTAIVSGHYDSYDGMRIGIVSDQGREAELATYAQEKGFDYELVYYQSSPELADALQIGEIDAAVSTSLRFRTNEWTIDSFNEAPIYVAVRKGDAKTLALVNAALDRMAIEEQHWITDLTQKYYGASESSIPFFTEEENAYIKLQQDNGRKYRVLVNPDREPYSYIDDEGRIAGIMPDLFDLIATKSGIAYEWVIARDREHYAELLRSDDVEICIDIVTDFYTAEQMGFSITDSYLNAPFAWIRRNDSSGNIEVAAQVVHNTYSSSDYLYNSDQTEIEFITYPTREECFYSVINGETDGFCTYAFEAEQFVLNHPETQLNVMVSQSANEFSIGVSHQINRHLTSILNTAISCIDNQELNDIIRRHTTLSVPDYSLLEVFFTSRQLQMIVALSLITFVLLLTLIVQKIRYQGSLKETIRHQAVKLDESKQTMMDILATAIEFRSCESGEHVIRIRRITHDILTELCHMYPYKYPLTKKDIDLISTASVLHDVGKIAVPDHILNKPGKLTPTEFSFIKEHPIKGCELLEHIPDLENEPLYAYAYDICRWHHERWDGKGYPDGLAGEDIPIWAQVTAIADVFDALTSPRVYKQAYSRDKAIAMIQGGECGSFNPMVVNALSSIAYKYGEVIPAGDQADIQRAPAGKDIMTLMLSAFQSLISNSSDRIFLKDVDLVYRAVSPSFAAMLGLTPEEVVTHTDAELVSDDVRAKRYTEDDIQLLSNGVDLVDMIDRISGQDGMTFYGSTTKRLLTDSQGRIMGILGVTRDITAAYLSARHHQLELKNLNELPPDAYYAIYIDLVTWHINNENVQPVNGVLFGKHISAHDLAKLICHSIEDKDCQAYDFYSRFDARTLRGIYEEGNKEFALEYKRQLPGGGSSWIRDEVKFLIDPTNGHLSLLLCARDISKRVNPEVSYLAYHDILTGLLNRAFMRQRIREELANAEGTDTTHALIMIDMDNFKSVNDALGHKAGDELLIRFAGKLQSLFRSSDYVGRLGGDEFLVLMRNIKEHGDVCKKADQLLNELQWAVGGDEALRISASIGIAFYPNDGRTLEELYDSADKAMYRSKHGGKNRYSVGTKQA